MQKANLGGPEFSGVQDQRLGGQALEAPAETPTNSLEPLVLYPGAPAHQLGSMKWAFYVLSHKA